MTIDMVGRDDVPSERRMRQLAMVTAVVAIAPLSLLGVAVTAASWWEGATAAIGYLLALGVLREWSLDRYPRRAMFALIFTAVGWGVGSLTASSPISFVPLSLIGAMLLARSRRRTLWFVVFAAGVAGMGASALVFHPVTWELVTLYLVSPALGTLFITGVIVFSEHVWLVVRRLKVAARTEAELAVANERMRFAGDLHDIQGHTLHVIKLKAALARRLVATDPDRAISELDDIRQLTSDTIAETRTLAYARHRLNLLAELENATKLCQAVGIQVRTEVADGTGASPHELLAQVLREATTNLLRHASPERVTIIATPDRIEITNDGVGAEGAALRGLARLRERLEANRGTLFVQHTPPTFTVSAHINSPSVETPARSAS
ncbi:MULTISPECIES: sensor histidine kinase [unclassified Pseudoclavibacter]|uniref:sensor histidine kinase n=1 Tax=unclassified Pseudoclavibacter TaxID=2615177 RepID=UPI0012F109A2|nr:MULTISPECIES: histidine kinase [unclassified Pseudoclavibacter]MBF4457907.1 sensor histidine kinase [Pseudoclavibacter sp. VKM Ac-2867]VXC08501.1 Sensor histidine kinase [Pseudoclavibacter sp. 8L]